MNHWNGPHVDGQGHYRISTSRRDVGPSRLVARGPSQRVARPRRNSNPSASLEHFWGPSALRRSSNSVDPPHRSNTECWGPSIRNQSDPRSSMCVTGHQPRAETNSFLSQVQDENDIAVCRPSIAPTRYIYLRSGPCSSRRHTPPTRMSLTTKPSLEQTRSPAPLILASRSPLESAHHHPVFRFVAYLFRQLLVYFTH